MGWYWWLVVVAIAAVKLASLVVVGAIWYYRRIYVDQVVRIFEERPLFIIPRGAPVSEAEDIRFGTSDGLTLQGCYLSTKKERKGVILFGTEFGSNRWSCIPYCGRLLDAGYDVFAFEPRNQGESDRDDNYKPLQWVSDKDLEDMRAAIAYLKSRRDRMEEGIGIFGVSKGGSTGLMAAAVDPWIRCVATDGAYGAYTTMIPYMRKWVSIYSPSRRLQTLVPDWFYGQVGVSAIRKASVMRAVRFLSVEKALKRLKVPLFMVQGQADNYIRPEMTDILFDIAESDEKSLWVVPGAKHNQAIHMASAEYSQRLVRFFDRHLAGLEVETDSAELLVNSPSAV